MGGGVREVEARVGRQGWGGRGGEAGRGVREEG